MQHAGGNIVYPTHLTAQMAAHMRPHIIPNQEFLRAPGHPAHHMVMAQPQFHTSSTEYGERGAAGPRPPSHASSQPSPRATPATPTGQVSPAIPASRIPTCSASSCGTDSHQQDNAF